MVLPISNFVRISIVQAPSGLATPNINSVLLLSSETPNNLDDYRIYLNASQVAEDYGTSSVTAAMANNIFSQTPNILSGGGRLVIAPLQSAVKATIGDFTTTDISANLTNLQAVSDGDLRITLNGTAIDLTGLDFTAATSLDDVVRILGKRSELRNLQLELVGGNAIKGTSKIVGASSAVIFEQLPTGLGTDLSGATLLNTAAGTATAGIDSSGETIQDAITRLENLVEFYNVITDMEIEDAKIPAIASFIQARRNIFCHHFSDANALESGSVCDNIATANQEKTRCVFYSTNPADANLFKAAYISKQSSVNFAGINTARTDNLNQFANVLADTTLNQTEVDKAVAAGVVTYGNYRINAVKSPAGNNFYDTVYNKLSLELNLEVAGVNYLATTVTKIPQTEEGMNGLKDSYRNVLNQFVRNGVIGTGLTWNSPNTFGNPEDLKRNVTDVGFFIHSQPIAQQAQPDREARKAPLIQIAIKFAGAIHSSEVLGIVEA